MTYRHMTPMAGGVADPFFVYTPLTADDRHPGRIRLRGGARHRAMRLRSSAAKRSSSSSVVT
jgi:hypothetical protein